MRNASTAGVQPGLSRSKQDGEGQREREEEWEITKRTTLGKIEGAQGEFKEYCKRYVLQGCVDHPSVGHCSCTPVERRQKMFDKRERLIRSLDRILDEFNRERSFAEN